MVMVAYHLTGKKPYVFASSTSDRGIHVYGQPITKARAEVQRTPWAVRTMGSMHPSLLNHDFWLDAGLVKLA